MTNNWSFINNNRWKLEWFIAFIAKNWALLCDDDGALWSVKQKEDKAWRVGGLEVGKRGGEEESEGTEEKGRGGRIGGKRWGEAKREKMEEEEMKRGRLGKTKEGWWERNMDKARCRKQQEKNGDQQRKRQEGRKCELRGRTKGWMKKIDFRLPIWIYLAWLFLHTWF